MTVTTAGPRQRRWVTLRTRRPALSLRFRPRAVAAITATAVLLAGAGGFALTLGDFPVALADVARLTLGLDQPDTRAATVVRLLRLPRMLTAVAAGAAFGISGHLFQRLLRNPLVAPDVIGVSAGATVAAVVWIVTAGVAALLPVAAFTGALVATAALAALTWRRGATGPRLVLVGIGLHAALTAATTTLKVRFPLDRAAAAVQWEAGSLVAADWTSVRMLVIGLVVLTPPVLAASRPLHLLELGDSVATALGTAVGPVRITVLVVATGLAAVATAAVGPVPFVALIAPHVARLLLSGAAAGAVALSGLVGALLLVVSDAAAQHAFSPIALPAGAVTAAVGAPYFLFLLYRANREGAS